VQDGSYKPLSRPLFIYVTVSALEDKEQVSGFLTYLLDHERALARKALFVPLTDEQLNKSQTVLEGAGIEAGSE
jgi:phosphate transport system substrate-binding protein